jgi:hypothetical protein
MSGFIQVCSWCRQPGALAPRHDTGKKHIVLCESCALIHDQEKKSRRNIQQNERHKRYHTDPEYRVAERKRSNEYQRKKYREDPEFRAKTIARVIANQKRKRRNTEDSSVRSSGSVPLLSSVFVQNPAGRLPVQPTDTDTDTEFCIPISSLSLRVQKTYRIISPDEADALVKHYFHSNTTMKVES